MTDPHVLTKLASITSLEECDGWIAACRSRGDEVKAHLGVVRRAEIDRRNTK